MWRCPAGEVWSRRVSAQISACLMSQRPGCHPAVRRAASTGTAKRVVEVRSVCICSSFVEVVWWCGVVQPSVVAAGSTMRTPKWAVRAVQARQGVA